MSRYVYLLKVQYIRILDETIKWRIKIINRMWRNRRFDVMTSMHCVVDISTGVSILTCIEIGQGIASRLGIPLSQQYYIQLNMISSVCSAINLENLPIQDLFCCYFPFVITGDCRYLCVGSELHSLLSGDSVAGVEDGCSGDGSEHGQILQTHLRGSILT